MRACRFITRQELLRYNSFSIPSLGTFKQFPELHKKEYSHYHGYAIQVGFKKKLKYLPETNSGKLKNINNTSNQADTLSALVASKTGITRELASLYIDAMVEIMMKGIADTGRIYISGFGLFKEARFSDNKSLILYKADAGLRRFMQKNTDIKYPGPQPVNKLSVIYSQKIPVEKRTENKFSAQKKLSQFNKTISALSDMHESVASVKNFPHPGHLTSNTPDAIDTSPTGTGGGGDGNSYKMSKIVPIETLMSRKNKHALSEPQKKRPVNISGISKETFINEQKELLTTEKHPYFEWFIIALFLTILAAGIYVIKPSVTPETEFDSTPFTFSKVIKTNGKKAVIPKSTSAAGKPSIAENKLTPAGNNSSNAMTNYRIKKGDTLWAISKKIYNNPYLWPLIYAANADQLKSPDSIEISGNLKIPNIQGSFENMSPKTQKNVKNAYLKVYTSYQNSGRPDANDYLQVARNRYFMSGNHQQPYHQIVY